MKILSIDVGILHLAMVGVNLGSDYLKRPEIINNSEITLCELINITDLVYYCDDKECELYHDKIICDYMMHLFKKFKKEYEEADCILIERQPLVGLVAVQELIMREYRNKAHLVSPCAMLNYFGILQYTYEERKVHTEKFARKYLENFDNYKYTERKHDLADSLCILYYYLTTERNKYVEQVSKIDVCLNFEKFRHVSIKDDRLNKEL